MPRYYLHICDGIDFVEDEEGQELSDEDGARNAAMSGARDLMAADVQRGELDLASFIEVEDENHQWLFTLTFAEAVALKSEAQPIKGAGKRKRIGH